jgi:hypothetical protein
LPNVQAFLAKRFFYRWVVLFEVPTGVIAHHRGPPHLLPPWVLTLAMSTVLVVLHLFCVPPSASDV